MGTTRKGLTIAGWVLSAILALLLAFSAVMKFLSPKELVDQFVGTFGYPEGLAPIIGAVELASLVVFLIPRTAALGAILLTGYLGGAVATHVRVGDAFVLPVVVGAAAWLALVMRDPRTRAVLPFGRANS